MAMSIAMLALLGEEVMLRNPSVVAKSYPGFWTALQEAGFVIRAAVSVL
jgi:5-enolpyruvylshikimate-3-phosphate synthase